MRARTPADFLRDIDVRNRAAADYDQFATDLAELAEEMAEAGAALIARELRRMGYIAARASWAEHMDPEPRS